MSKQIEVIVPPTIQAMMSGACFAQILTKGSPRLVRLHYTDNSTEDAWLKAEEVAAGKENWFSLVSAVQATRHAPNP